MTTLAEQFWCATVLATVPLSPVMRRIVLGGEGLSGYESSGAPDEWLRVMVPTQRQREVALPTRQGQSWVFGTPAPAARWYSVRRFEAGSEDRGAELTIDVVRHEEGLATRWAADAAIGDQVLVSQPHGRWHDVTADWMIIVADQTGIPAACRILDELPGGQRAYVLFEAPYEAATFTPQTSADLELTWVYNPSPATIDSPLAAAVRSLELPSGEGYVWMAGEAGCSRDIRRYIRHELKWRSTRFDITGYWRPDQAAYDRRYTAVEDEVAAAYARGRAAGRDTAEITDDVFAVMETHGL